MIQHVWSIQKPNRKPRSLIATCNPCNSALQSLRSGKASQIPKKLGENECKWTTISPNRMSWLCDTKSWSGLQGSVGCRKATNHLCCLIFWYNITEKNCHIPTDSKASYATEGLTILITGPVELRTNTPATITPNPVVLRANDHEFANRIQ